MNASVKFLALTYTMTWTGWGLATAMSGGTAPTPALAGLRSVLFYIGVFAPSLVALALTARAEGTTGVRTLLQRILQWRVGWRWYVFAVGYMAAVKLSVALVHRVATGEWPRFGQTPVFIMVIAIVISTWIQAGEEIGWRGYALPRLAERMGFGSAGVLLGVIWAVWHLPLFLIPGTDTTGQSFPVYLLQVTAISVAMTWLYWKTDGSLLLVMILHAAVNNTKDIVPSAVSGATNAFALSSSLVAWLTVALLWICAAYFLIQMRTGRTDRS
jgi:uncharacterized protein